jgi:hypothetical protein
MSVDYSDLSLTPLSHLTLNLYSVVYQNFFKNKHLFLSRTFFKGGSFLINY